MSRRLALATAIALTSAPLAAAEFGGYGMSSLTIGVKDEARSMAFYSVLGLKKGRLHHPGHQEMRWDNASMGPSIVLNSNADAHAKMVPGAIFFVMFVPHVATTVKALRDAGFPVEGEARTLPTHDVIIVTDPDGNRIELVGPTKK